MGSGSWGIVIVHKQMTSGKINQANTVVKINEYLVKV